MNLIEEAKKKIKGKNLKLVMPEGNDDRIRRAAAHLEREGLAETILFDEGNVPDVYTHHINAVRSLRPKMTDHMAERLLSRPLHHAGALVATGDAHAMLAGVQYTTAKVIEAAMMTIGLADDISLPSSYFLMLWPDRHLIFADCAVNIDPTAAQLADIAIATAASARAVLGDVPRVALLSFSTNGSAKHACVERVTDALSLVRSRKPDLFADGELQLDTAVSPEVAARKLGRESAVAGRANVLIFPNLDAGNIAYKTAQHLGGAQAIGPVLQGFAKPVSDLSRGASVEDIVATAVLLLTQVK